MEIRAASQLSRLSAPELATKPEDSPRNIAKAASDFEALLVAQLLRSARGSDSGWLATGDDQSSSSLLEMGEEQLAQSITAAGGLGLAKMIVQGLRRPGAGAIAPAATPTPAAGRGSEGFPLDRNTGLGPNGARG
jgi:Rod binding domain-containing protein